MVRRTFHTKTVGFLNKGYFGLTIWNSPWQIATSLLFLSLSLTSASVSLEYISDSLEKTSGDCRLALRPRGQSSSQEGNGATRSSLSCMGKRQRKMCDLSLITQHLHILWKTSLQELWLAYSFLHFVGCSNFGGCSCKVKACLLCLPTLTNECFVGSQSKKKTPARRSANKAKSSWLQVASLLTSYINLQWHDCIVIQQCRQLLSQVLTTTSSKMSVTGSFIGWLSIGNTQRNVK